jgi:hypothetical protein
LPECLESQLVCKGNSRGVYKLYRKKWVSCSRWNLWKTCSIWNNWIWEFGNGINTYLNTIALTKKLKSKTDNKFIYKIIDRFSKELVSKEIDYYANFNYDIYTDYSKIVKWFNDFILKIDSYIKTKDKKDRNDAIFGYKSFLKIRGFDKTFSNRYVTKKIVDSKEIWVTKYRPISKLVWWFEIKVLKKLKLLLDTKTINEKTYYKAIKDYNEFILHLTIYRMHKVKSAAYRALIPGKSFYKIYKMKVIY